MQLQDIVKYALVFLVGIVVGTVQDVLSDILRNAYRSIVMAWRRRDIYKSTNPNTPRILMPVGLDTNAPQGILLEAPSNYFEDHGFTFGWLNTPDYVPIYGNGIISYPRIRWVHDVGNVFETPGEIRALWESILAELQAQSATNNRPFTPGPIARLLSCSPPADEGDEMMVRTGCANYHQYCVSMELLLRDYAGLITDREGKPLHLRAKYGIRSRSFDSPLVCGALGVEIALLTSDQKVVIVRRSLLSAYMRGLFLASIGECLHPAKDSLPQTSNERLMDPFETTVRGAREELGIDISAHQITFLALGIHKATMDPDLLGVARIAHTQNDIEYALLSSRPSHKWEASDLRFIDFSPGSVAQFIRTAGVDKLTPAAPVCLAFALLNSFPEREVRKAFVG
jgi:hypothetical protein